MPAACFIASPECVLDWDGINAVATFLAGAIALVATYSAVRVPYWTKRGDRSDTTNEILQMAIKAISLFREAERSIGKIAKTSTLDIKVLAAQARHLRTALDRIASRPELTDGAIFVAAGAIELLSAIDFEAEKYRTLAASEFTPHIVNNRGVRDLEYFIDLIPVIDKRAKEVANYAVKRRWPKWKERFSMISSEGVDRISDRNGEASAVN